MTGLVCVRCRAVVECTSEDFEDWTARCPNGCHEGVVPFQGVAGEGETWWARQPGDTRSEDEVRSIHEAREARGEAARVAYAAGDWQTFARLVQADVDDAAAEKAAEA